MGEDLYIAVEHPGFAEVIENAMADEMEIAKGKWKVYLTSEEESHILSESAKQLRYKARLISGDDSWEIGSTEIRIHPIKADEAPRLSEVIRLPQEARTKDIRLIEVNSGWKIDVDDSIDATPIFRFADRVKSRLEEWARTAVYYGVASYREGYGK